MRRLLEVTGWRGPVDVGSAWDPIEDVVGRRLPDDVKALAAEFPTGYFGSFLAVYSPVPRSTGWSPFGVELAGTLELLRERDDLPHPVHPEPGGLLPWGSTTSAHTLCWLTTDADPNRWPVVVADDDFARWGAHPGPATGFLLDVLTGRWRHEFFDDRVRGRRPRFDPIEEVDVR
ncbi:hypothetical protein [Actinosynnema sp. NPDC020468]|uniref:hypothetical protein n=1 Tax=Actinosynnema sp. NPDC020468 TaxID=3154488 RepID=UPI0033F8F69C